MFWNEEVARLNWIVRFIAFFPKEATHATQVDRKSWTKQMQNVNSYGVPYLIYDVIITKKYYKEKNFLQ